MGAIICTFESGRSNQTLKTGIMKLAADELQSRDKSWTCFLSGLLLPSLLKWTCYLLEPVTWWRAPSPTRFHVSSVRNANWGLCLMLHFGSGDKPIRSIAEHRKCSMSGPPVKCEVWPLGWVTILWFLILLSCLWTVICLRANVLSIHIFNAGKCFKLEKCYLLLLPKIHILVSIPLKKKK